MDTKCPACGEDYGTGGRASHTCHVLPVKVLRTLTFSVKLNDEDSKQIEDLLQENIDQDIEIRRLRKREEESERLLRLLEWKEIYPDTGEKLHICPICHGRKPNHNIDPTLELPCALAAWLKGE